MKYKNHLEGKEEVQISASLFLARRNRETCPQKGVSAFHISSVPLHDASMLFGD
jgi:hypothetical protein